MKSRKPRAAEEGGRKSQAERNAGTKSQLKSITGRYIDISDSVSATDDSRRPMEDVLGMNNIRSDKINEKKMTGFKMMQHQC